LGTGRDSRFGPARPVQLQNEEKISVFHALQKEDETACKTTPHGQEN
jgi:hypothetical protein